MQGGDSQQSNENEGFYEQPQTSSGATENQPPAPTEQVNTNQPMTDEPVVSWEASEYIHHQKGSSWYLGFAGVMLIIVAVIYFLIREIFSVIVMIIMGAAIAVYAGRKPETIRYSLSRSSIAIGEKQYSLDEFSSFALMQDGGIYSVMLMPTKRFMPPVSIYFAPEDGDQILDVLSASLPHEERQPDVIDRLMRNIRF